MPASWRLFWRALQHLRQYWRVYGGLLLVYGVLNLLLVRGLSSGFNVQQVKTTLGSFLGGGPGGLSNSLAIFGLLVGNSGSASSDVAGVYQSILLIVISLALIWALRQTHLPKPTKFRVREAFYQGMYPLIPFLLLLIIIGLQFIPLLVGGTIYATVIGNGLAATSPEKVLWGMLFFLFGLLTLYMITSSLFALYIVTLPNMTPLKALRSARQLVLYRRWTVLRKLLFLPLILVILAAVFTIPTIMFAASLAEWVFFVFTLVALVLVHSYMYTLYRELL